MDDSIKTILVAGGELVAVDRLCQIAEAAGYRSLHALTRSAAISQVWTLNPDLVILDLTLPIVDVASVCQLLEADPAKYDQPCILISADERPAVIDYLKAVAILPPQVEPARLVETIAALIEPHAFAVNQPS